LVVVDGIFLIVVFVAGIRAAVRGFVAELFTVAAVAGGILLATLLHPPVAVAMDGWWGPSGWNRVVAFLAIFLLGYVLLKIVESWFHRFFEALQLQKLDHVLGLFLGVAEGLTLTFAVFVLLTVQTLIDTEPWFAGSFFDDLFVPLVLDALVPPVAEAAGPVAGRGALLSV
jgi:uncharacterized membrane protein required for colicin V production